MKKNKLLAVLLALAMTLSLLPTAALAAEAVTLNVDPNATYENAPNRGESAPYKTIAEALEKAENGDTVKLLNDVTESVVIPAGANIVLDLGGKTLTDNGSYAIYNKGTLSLKNGTINQTSNNYALNTYSGSKTTILSGTFIQNAAKNLIYAKARVVIKDGEFIQNAKASLIHSYGSGTKVEIEGGTFKDNSEAENIFTIYSSGRFSISGGRFSKPVNNAYCSGGHVLTEEPDAEGHYCVRVLTNEEAPAVLTYKNSDDQAVTEYFADPATALEEATGKTAAVVTVVKNVTTNTTLNAYNAKLVVNEGAVLTSTASTAIFVSAQGTTGVTVVNYGTIIATAGKSGKIVGSLGNGILCNEATGKIECKVLEAKTCDTDSKNWYNAGVITLTSLTPSTLNYFTNNGTIQGKDMASKLTVGSNGVSGDGNTFDKGTYIWNVENARWDRDANVQILHGGVSMAGYSTLSNAMNAAEAGDTVQLLKNISETLTISKNITLDLNGKTISAPSSNFLSNYILSVPAGKTVTIKNGTINTNRPVPKGILYINGGTVTAENLKIDTSALSDSTTTGVYLEAGSFTLDATSSILASESGIFTLGNSVANIYGKVETTAESNSAAIMGNGKDETAPGTTINIYEGAKIKTNGTGLGIYHPQVGTLNIAGGTITGNLSAVEIRAGKMTIDGGEFTATAPEFSIEPNGSGTTTSGAAIAIAQHTTKKDIKVEITDGTFNGVRALNESNPQENDPAPQVALTVSGGTFNGDVVTVDVDHFISGGTFSSDPSAYVADDYIVRKDTAYVVVKDTDLTEGIYMSDPSGSINAEGHLTAKELSDHSWAVGKSYTAAFTTAPDAATVTVKLADDTAVSGTDKTFADLNSALTYNYTVSCSGYYSKSGTIDASTLTWDETNSVWNLPVIHVALSAIPSDSDSSGSSSTTTPSKPTTSTETKPDGSTTTTESKPDGTVTESNTSKPVTDASGNTSQTTTETTTGKDGVTESKTETVTKPDGSASSTTESTTTKPDGTKTESSTETTINKDGSTASTTTETTTNKDGTVTESKTEATTSTVTNKDGSTTETKQETTTTSTGSKTESTTVTTVNKDGSSTATTTATTTDKAGTVTESKTESTTNKNGTTTEKTTTTETKANGTVTESKTETTINKDGSSKATTTETITKADGTKVESKTTATTSLSTNKTTGTVTETKKETTTTSDGVKSEGTTVTQIQKDGTVTSTETVKASDSTGTTATKTTTLDAKGNVTTAAEATVSTKAVTEAAKTGGAVTLPVEVTATKSASTAPTVAVSVPKTAESVKVELPVENVTPGTVAVIVNADGTEKIVSTSVVTENGVALTLDGSATVKLVDNAKSFVDVPETNVFYNEISSLSARNIMIGVSSERFDLHNSVTLDQVANVAGRITGAVDVSDFNAGVAWGKDGGLKTGSMAATRGEVLKALYIAAGSPAVEDTSILSHFKDASSIPADLAAIAAWAAQNGILKGNMDGTAALGANVTRGQACALAGRTMGTLA